ncbi:hypothetical protein MVEG_11124 [Podila verticillata NRRL 6337]|uniref:F-box domain-containing protein n=1 Tax=Podila verticillata NRRL 6337 TaxID=1069443 RepID=A0A086TMB0_9FUNG|nr:hypothetical protein MVEG_11124 [Podila verticillata NRRL 6337]
MDNWNIPKEIRQAQSRHFRHLRLSKLWPPNTLQSAQLRTLDIWSNVLLEIGQLLTSNTQLSELTLRFQSRASYHQIWPIIEPLSRLKVIRLCYLTLTSDDNQLDGFFNNNPGLQELELKYLEGVTGLKGCHPLVNLTRIYIAHVWKDNMGMLELFQLCPNLVSISLFLDARTPAELPQIVRANCPKLEAIECLDNLDLKRSVLNEEDAMAWIGLPTRLVSFSAPLLTFTNRVYLTFLHQASSLETVRLELQEIAMDSLVQTSKLLANCPSLRHLKIVHIQDHYRPNYLDPVSDWFDGTQHPSLQTLEIGGFVVAWEPGLQDGTYISDLKDIHQGDDDSECGSDQEDGVTSEGDASDSEQGSDHSDSDSEGGSDQSLSNSEDESDESDEEGLDRFTQDGSSSEESSDQGETGSEHASEEEGWGQPDESDSDSGSGPNTGNMWHADQDEEKGLCKDVSKCTAEQEQNAKLPPCHPAADQEFMSSIANRGWAFERDIDKHLRRCCIYFMSRDARSLRNRVFGGLIDSPHLCKITLENFVYVNNGRRPRA